MTKKIEDIKQVEKDNGESDGNGNGRSVRQIEIEKDNKRSFNNNNGQTPPSIMREKKTSRFGIWFGVIIVIIILFFVISLIFSGATVTVEPKTADISVDATFSASREPILDEELAFDVMSVSREATKEVAASGEEFVEEKASGTIVIFNDFGTASQKLISNTRFETPSGLIYRIKDAVTVPGRTTVSGVTEPGSLEVTVYADEAGEEYNIGLSDFTIPGLKGDPRFDKMFARSKTAMAGGFEGNLKTASSEDLRVARTELESKLESELLAEASSVLPEGFILLDKSYDISFEERQENSTGENVRVVEKGTLTAYIFEESELARFLADNLVSSYDDAPVELNSEENLKMTLTEDVDANATEIEFSLEGGAKIVWSFDETELKDAIKGESRRRLASVLSRFSGIENADTTIRPFWKRSMPDNPEDIKIEEVIK